VAILGSSGVRALSEVLTAFGASSENFAIFELGQQTNLIVKVSADGEQRYLFFCTASRQFSPSDFMTGRVKALSTSTIVAEFSRLRQLHRFLCCFFEKSRFPAQMSRFSCLESGKEKREGLWQVSIISVVICTHSLLLLHLLFSFFCFSFFFCFCVSVSCIFFLLQR
jgi:hypothetical protein